VVAYLISALLAAGGGAAWLVMSLTG